MICMQINWGLFTLGKLTSQVGGRGGGYCWMDESLGIVESHCDLNAKTMNIKNLR